MISEQTVAGSFSAIEGAYQTHHTAGASNSTPGWDNFSKAVVILTAATHSAAKWM